MAAAEKLRIIVHGMRPDRVEKSADGRFRLYAGPKHYAGDIYISESRLSPADSEEYFRREEALPKEGVKCPKCDKGTIYRELVLLYNTKLGGKPLIVKFAEIDKCDTCDEEIVTAKELARWREQQKEQEITNGPN